MWVDSLISPVEITSLVSSRCTDARVSALDLHLQRHLQALVIDRRSYFRSFGQPVLPFDRGRFSQAVEDGEHRIHARCGLLYRRHPEVAVAAFPDALVAAGDHVL